MSEPSTIPPLLPCPFDGMPANYEVKNRPHSTKPTHEIWCECSRAMVIEHSMEAAVTAWNQRAKKQDYHARSYDIHVRDLIESIGFKETRIHEVTAIILGGAGQESVVELHALDHSDPCNADGKKQHAAIPFEMLCAGIDAGIFKHTPASDLDSNQPKKSLC